MKLNVKRKDISVLPRICEEQGSKFSLVFRYPNQYDATKMVELQSSSDFVDWLNGLFIEFKHKSDLILEDEDGKEVEYQDFKDMMLLGGSELSGILADVIVRMQDEVKKLSSDLEKAKETEKK